VNFVFVVPASLPANKYFNQVFYGRLFLSPPFARFLSSLKNLSALASENFNYFFL